MLKRIWGTASLALALYPAALDGQQLLRGEILRLDGSPLRGATITVTETGASVQSDSSGRFELPLGAGQHKVRIRRLGYQPLDTVIAVEANLIKTVRLFVTEAATVLQPVTVSDEVTFHNPLMADFAERRKVGIGSFMTPDQLTALNHVSFESVLRRLGVKVELTPCGGSTGFRPCRRPYAQARRGQFSMLKEQICPAQVYLDGVMMPNEPVPFDVGLIKTQDIAGVEFYKGAAEAPLIFEKGDARCGVLVLWTRFR